MEKKSKEKWQSLSKITTNELLKDNIEKSPNTDQLYEILDLNAEQLTYYIEEAIIENPFIEIDYALETRVSTIKNASYQHLENEVERNSPGMAQSLIMFLFEQIMMYRHTPIRDVMVRLVDYLDEKGYLPYRYQELATKLNEDDILVLDAMTLFKQLEPAGVGAYDLQECLMLQTEQDSHAPNIAYLLLEEHFDLISKQDVDSIHQVSGFPREEIEASLNYFHSLRPVPAAVFDKADKVNLIPDVSVRYNQDDIELRYNRQYYPRIIFNQKYYDEMALQNDTQLFEYITTHRQNFQVLAYNLRVREQLVLAAVEALVLAQKDYLTEIKNEKRPYLIKDLASDLDIPEALAHLVVTNKNLEMKFGIIPLTDLINVTHHQGRGGLNTVNIKEIMANIIENSPQELTNNEIVAQLAAQKIIMSEQLVADYRKALE